MFNGITEEVAIDTMTRELYQKKYRGHLFCPNVQCNAKIEFNPGIKKSFRCSNKSEHVSGCCYLIKDDNSEKKIPIPDKKIHSSLEYQIERFVNGVKKRKYGEDRSKVEFSRESDRRIRYYRTYLINDRLLNKEGICTGDIVKQVVYFEDHIYIDIEQGKIDILINNKNFNIKMKTIADIIDSEIKSGNRVVCMCYGEVVRKKKKCGEKEYNIIPCNESSLLYRVM